MELPLNYFTPQIIFILCFHFLLRLKRYQQQQKITACTKQGWNFFFISFIIMIILLVKQNIEKKKRKK